MKVTARQDREPIVDGILSGWKEVNLHLIFSGIILVVEVNSFSIITRPLSGSTRMIPKIIVTSSKELLINK